MARPPRQFATQNIPKGHGLLDGGVWFLKDGTKHGSRGISLHTNSSSVRAAFGPCPGAGGAAPKAVAAPPKPKAVGNQKLSWEERKQFWQGSQNAATTHTDFGDRAGVLVQREVPSVLVNGGHKIACRMYMVIVRTDPLLVVWGTSTSYVKVTPELYRAGATDLKSQVSDSFRSTGTDGSGNVDNKAGAAQEGAEGWQALPPFSLLACECSVQRIGVVAQAAAELAGRAARDAQPGAGRPGAAGQRALPEPRRRGLPRPKALGIPGDPSHCVCGVERRAEISGLGSLAGCFLALGSGLRLVGTASSRR